MTPEQKRQRLEELKRQRDEADRELEALEAEDNMKSSLDALAEVGLMPTNSLLNGRDRAIIRDEVVTQTPGTDTLFYMPPNTIDTLKTFDRFASLAEVNFMAYTMERAVARRQLSNIEGIAKLTHPQFSMPRFLGFAQIMGGGNPALVNRIIATMLMSLEVDATGNITDLWEVLQAFMAAIAEDFTHAILTKAPLGRSQEGLEIIRQNEDFRDLLKRLHDKLEECGIDIDIELE